MNTAIGNSNVELIFVVALISGISALAWLLMANPLRLYRVASLRFALANIFTVGVVVCGTLRTSPESPFTLLSVGLVVAALSMYDLAIRRLFRVDDSRKLPVFTVCALAFVALLWVSSALPELWLAAFLYALASVILLRTSIKKVRLVVAHTSRLAGWFLSLPDFLVTIMLAVKATMLICAPQQMWSFMVSEGDNTLAIWVYIVLTLTINVTAFASALSRIILRMKHLATHDQLTGLYNRRAISENLTQCWEKYRQMRTPFSILMLDVDHFKRINDQFGHHAGDQALRYIADLLIAHTTPEQAVARFGGEEFIVLLPDTDMPAACTLANHLCETINAAQWHPQAGRMSVSIGCGSADQADSLDHLLSQADHALYDAKHSGRAQVKLFYASSSASSTC